MSSSGGLPQLNVKLKNIFSWWREDNDETADESEIEYLKLFKQFLLDLPTWISPSIDSDLTPDLLQFLTTFISNWLKRLEMTITAKDLSELLQTQTGNNAEEYHVLNFCRHACAMIVKQDELYIFITRAKQQALNYEYVIKRYPSFGKQNEAKTRIIKAIVSVPQSACKLTSTAIFTPQICEELQAMQKTASYSPDNLAEARLPNFLLGWFGAMFHGEPLTSKPTIPMSLWSDGEGSGRSRTHPISWRRSIHWETMRMLLRFVIVDAGWSISVYKKLIVWFLTWLLDKEIISFFQQVPQHTIPKTLLKFQGDYIREMALKISRKVTKLTDAIVASKVQEIVTNDLSKLTAFHDQLLKEQYERSAIGDLRTACTVTHDAFALSEDWLKRITTDLEFANSTPAKAELGHFTILPFPDTENPQKPFDVIAYLTRMEDWMNTYNNPIAKQCAVRFAEDAFFVITWGKAPLLLTECQSPPMLKNWWNAASPRVSGIEKSTIITDQYVDAVNSFMKSYLKALAVVPKSARQLSRTIIMAFCVTITIESITYVSEDGFLDEYRTGLRSVAMNNLILDETQEFYVTAGIHKYLEDQLSRPKILFGGERETDLEFSAAYAAKDETLMKIVEEESQHSSDAVKNYIQEVTRKKDEATKYRLLNESIQDELKAATTAERNYLQRQASLPETSSERDSATIESERKTQLATARQELETKATQISAALKEAEELPPPIVNPLPSDPMLARSTIFFIFIPKKFGMLSEWTVYTKELTACGFIGKKKSQLSFKVNWDDFFFQYNRGNLSRARKREFIGGPKLVFPEEIKLPTDKNVSVIDPQAFTFAIAYRFENSFFELALFGLIENPILAYFAGEEDVVANQLMRLPNNPDEECIRENEILTTQYRMPEYMNKKGWYALGKIRAHRVLQLRQILIILKEKSVPFTEPLVQQVILYAIQEIGPFHPLAISWRYYKTDMSWISFRDEFASAIVILAEEVGPKSRDHAELLLLIELCNWLTCFTPTILKALTIIARTALTWEAEAEMVASQLIDNPEELENIGLIQQYYRIYAYLALAGILPDLWQRYVHNPIAGSEFTAEEISALSAMIRLRTAIAKGETLTPHPTIASLLDRVTYAQAKVGIYLIELLQVNAECTSKLLHKAVNATVSLNTTSSTAEVVPWNPIQSTSTATTHEIVQYSVSYEAYYDSNKYEINLFNGIILCNGYPISLLPQNILTTNLYTRTFGTTRFAVQLINHNCFRSLKAFNSTGLCYEFGLSGRNVPIIREYITSTDSNSSVRECYLLDNTSLTFLPKCLYENYSHWYCPATNTILFREIHFRGTPSTTSSAAYVVHVSYLLEVNINNKKGYCYRIPSYQQITCLSTFATPNNTSAVGYDEYKKDQLFPSDIMHLGSLIRLFNKFETNENIMIFGDNTTPSTTTNKVVRQIYLANYDLSFLVNHKEGYLQSEDFRDYRLSDYQTLSNTFLYYQSYLVLECLRPYDTSLPSKRLIAHLPEMKNRYAIWHVNRFQQLDAFSIEDRLSLALCYLTSGTRQVENAQNNNNSISMTGSEYALQLLSKCYSSSPYSPQAITLLYMIISEGNKGLYWMYPTVTLRAIYLIISSDECGFLYGNEKANEWEISADIIYCYDYYKQRLYNMRCLLTIQEEKMLFGGSLVEELSTSRIQHTCTIAIQWTSLIPIMQLYQSAYRIANNSSATYLSYLNNHLNIVSIRLPSTSSYPVSTTRYMNSYRDMGWMDELPIIFYSLYESLRTNALPRLLTQLKGIAVEAYLRWQFYGNYTTQQLYHGLLRILLLVGTYPNQFPAIWFPIPCELPYLTETILSEQEYHTIMLSTLTLPTGSNSTTEANMMKDQATEQIKASYLVFKAQCLDENHKPILTEYYQDFEGTKPLLPTLQSICANCNYNGIENALKSLEKKYRKVCLSMGITQFLEQIATICNSIVTTCLPDKQPLLYDKTIKPILTTLPTATTTAVMTIDIRKILLPKVDHTLPSLHNNPAFAHEKREIFWAWIDEELDNALHGAQGKAAVLAINPIRARKEKEQRLKEIQKIFATDITSVTPMMFMEMQTLLQEIQSLPAIEPANANNANALKFPLEAYPAKTNMGKEMNTELKSSWLQYKSELIEQEADLKAMEENLSKLNRITLEGIYKRIHAERMQLQAQLIHLIEIDSLPPQDSLLYAKYMIGITTNLIATPNLNDLLCIYGKKDHWFESLQSVLPFITYEIAQQISTLLNKLLVYRTYEDKVIRCQGMIGDVNLRPALLKELLSRHVERKYHHPLWQLLEVEQGFMIRDIQHSVVEQLLSNPNSLVQLNMGEGKTKVIMPMLVCALVDGKRLVRLNILRSLQAEVNDYLSNALGGTIGKRVYTFPFNRAVELDEPRAAILVRLMRTCCTEGSIVILAPEHRQSLQLKYMNMLSPHQTTKDWSKVIHLLSQLMPNTIENNATTATATAAEVDRIHFLDIMDECDEILKPARQLNYTIGAQTPLDGGSTRWRAAMTLLSFLDTVPEVIQLLNDPQQVERIPSDTRGGYTFIRLLDPKAIMPAIHKAMIDALFTSHAPREFANLKNQSKEWIEAAKRFILNDDLANKEKMEEVIPLLQRDSIFRALLVFRGLISFDILEFCLIKRHRVEYGTNRKRKDMVMRIAVPYVAKDVPSDRNVFGRADVTILLTCLSYYYEGLTYTQLRDTFQSLLDLGPSERNRRYREWLEYGKKKAPKRVMGLEKNASQTHLLIRQASMINTATIPEITDRIDLTNSIQLSLLYNEFYKNIEVINFFLECRVFPLETQQFPHKLLSTPWDLTESDEILGFSGTNDNSTSLPLAVRQETLPLLAGTNGKMLELLTAIEYHNTKFVLVDSTWKGILSTITTGSGTTVVNALLDSGAIMTGVSNREVIKVVLKESPAGRFQGGIFIDEKGKMVVREHSGRESYLNNSPIRPADCFVYLTDEYCRGTDLKLAPNAHAVVTLGKDLNKDQLVQTCMRLRQLGQGQTVSFYGTVEIARNICEVCALPCNDAGYHQITSVHVVRWTLENTIRSCEDAMLQWIRQGGLFFKRRKIPHAMYLVKSKPHLTPASPEAIKQIYSLSVENEVTTLKEMFSGCITTALCSDAAMTQTHTIYLKIGKTLETFLKNKHTSATSASMENNQITKQFWEEWTESLRQEFSDKSNLLNARTKQYVSHLWISSFVLDEEFEVELEIQAEFQLQRELPIQQETATESPCQLSIVSLCSLTKISEVLHALQPIEPLHQVFQLCSNPALQVLQFHKNNVYCTESFRMVLKDPKIAPDWYLKAVDVVLEIRVHHDQQEAEAEEVVDSNNKEMTHCFVVISGNEANALLQQFWKLRWNAIGGYNSNNNGNSSPNKNNSFVNKFFTQRSFETIRSSASSNGVIVTFHHLCAAKSCLSLCTLSTEDTTFFTTSTATSSANNSPSKPSSMMLHASVVKEADARVRLAKLTPLRMTIIELRLFMGQCNYVPEDELIVRRFLGVLSKTDREIITPEGCKVLQHLGIMTGTGYVIDPAPTGEPINLSTHLPPQLQTSATRIMNVIHRIHQEKQVTQEATVAIKALIQMRGEWVYFSRSTLDDIVSGIR